MYLHNEKEIFKDIINRFSEDIDISFEEYLLVPSFPVNNIIMNNYISIYFNKNDARLIEKYNLAPFEIKCQSLERTFIDKVFAICDYYLLNKSTRLSRHLYDIYKLYPVIKLANIKSLINDVRSLRSELEFCPSAKDNVDINKTLTEIIETNYYKNDYNNITARLIFDNVEYEDAINALNKIINNNLF